MLKHEAFPELPERISGLRRLSYNLWWSWNAPARNLFRMIDINRWRESGHNPIRMLSDMPQEMLDHLAEDPEFLAHYDAVMEQFDAAIGTDTGWFTANYGKVPGPIAYLCAEYGLHSSLPVYAGGLGILAGDYLKECSDLAIPVVGLGLIYSAGYVRQRIREDGWQEDVEETLDRTYDPIEPVLREDGSQLIVQVPIFDPPVYVAVWRVNVGRVPLYLMDTDIEQNQPWNRAIAQRLYASNPEQRLRQEIVLGMGGMRVLAALGIQPAAVHLNEGHPALALLERIREFVKAGDSFAEARQKVEATTIFTTHTPVAAGTDIFSFQLMEKYFTEYFRELGTDHDTFMQLGIDPKNPSAGFNMTVFALRMAAFRNAVSKRHGEVARKMWAHLWPDKPVEDVPITNITNGVHLATWVEPTQLQPLFNAHIGPAWLTEQDRPGVWELVQDIPDEALWRAHQDRKVLLLAQIVERARERWQYDKVAPGSIIAFGALLDPEVLTIGFARRMTSYKRPTLIFHNPERLKKLVTDPVHPVQIIFAGKAHPADTEGKQLIQTIFRLAEDPEFAGRIAFVENYDQRLAEYMVHGVDVWLNNPLPPLEASGTSGMKASVNGTPHLSILDGWWIEGYNGENGWAFGQEPVEGDRTAADAEAIYQLLEEKIIPCYYQRSDIGVPPNFVAMMKKAIQGVAPYFSTRRMAKEYVEKFYVNALKPA